MGGVFENCDHEIRVSHNDECVECTWQERERLRSELAAAQDEVALGKRRIRVLRGTDVLATASSRGVATWLRAIHGGITYGDNKDAARHLAALIALLESAAP